MLQDHYRMLAQKEKLDKESKRFVGRKLSYMQLSDKYGLSAAVARRRAGLPPISSAMTGMPFDSPGGAGTGEGGKQVEPSPSEARDISEVEALPEEMFTEEVDLCATTSLEQRLLNVDLQAESVSGVFPRHKHLMIKRSQRCRKCEHNLSKPEYNPSSIKFKIQLAAFYHVPEVVILAVEGAVAAGAEVVLVVKVVNPTQNATSVSFHGLEEYDLDREKRRIKEEEEMTAAASASQTATPGSADKSAAAVLDLKKKLSTGMLRSSASLVTASDLHKVPTNADLVGGATSEVMIPPRDDAAEFDDAGPAMVASDDDKSLVRWRRANKVGVALKAKIGEGIKKEEEAVVGVAMRFVYTNTISALEQREVQKADICLPIFVKLGKAA